MSDTRTVSRFEDMSPLGRLRLYRQPDGDVIVEVTQDPEGTLGFAQAHVEFTMPMTGGGGSEETFYALIKLFEAMEKDEKKRPQHREGRKR